MNVKKRLWSVPAALAVGSGCSSDAGRTSEQPSAQIAQSLGAQEPDRSFRDFDSLYQTKPARVNWVNTPFPAGASDFPAGANDVWDLERLSDRPWER